MSAPERNKRSALLLSLLVVGMFGFGFALVPLYGLICEVAGIQSVVAPTAKAAPRETPTGRVITVKFDATVHNDLPWEFAPEVRAMQVPVGKMQHMNYRARNLSALPVTGQAVPAVVPWQATDFFAKTECFCFTRQELAGGESREMPLAFMVSPQLPADIETLTLSYTFMNADAATRPKWELGRLGDARH